MNAARTDRIKILKQYLEEDDNDHFSRYALALEVMESGDVKEAIQLLRKVLIQNADFLAAYYQLGKACELGQAKDAAADAYRQGLEVARRQKNAKTESELKTALSSLLDDEE